jgi:hypothetical protein
MLAAAAAVRTKHAAVITGTPVPAGWRRHPSMPSLLCDGETGRVMKIMADGSIKEAGSACGNGRRWKVGAGGRMRYRVMYEAYHPAECDAASGHLAPTWEIDHINGDPTDDRIANLQKLSKSEHSRKPKAPPRKRSRVSLTSESSEDAVQWRSLACMDPVFAEYEVSSDGRVRNTASRRVLYGCTHKESGYVSVTLVRAPAAFAKDEPGRSVSVLMQRAVCWAFHGPPPSPEYTVDHIDRDRANNRAFNLRWATRSEQQMNRTWTKASVVLYIARAETSAEPVVSPCSDSGDVLVAGLTVGSPPPGTRTETAFSFATTSDAARYLKEHSARFADLSENAIRLRIRCALAQAGRLDSEYMVETV